MRVKFRPRTRIRRRVQGTDKNLVVFFPGTEYEGEILLDNKTIFCSCGKYPGTYELSKSEVKITMTL